MFLDTAFITDLHCSRIFFSPAAIIVNVPFCAPGKPPDTGESIILISVSFIASPICFASKGLIVEVMITVLFFFRLWISPSFFIITSLA
jgi:hypothetical protein